MNRRYTTEEFRNICNILRKAYPQVSLTTDIIVGFPGETEEEFNKTFNFLKEINFYKMHIFKYSPRKGTKAASMKEQIGGNIKEDRSQKLIMLSKKKEKKYNESYIGKELEVLFEERDREFYKGHTTNYIMVKTKEENENLENVIKTVKIEKMDDLNLIGKIAKK